MPDELLKEKNVQIPNARFAYDQFRLSQPQIEENGLWHGSDGMFYIVCPQLSATLLTKEGKILRDWFPTGLKPMGLPLRLVAEVPEGATKIKDRNIDEIALRHGSSKTSEELIYDLSAELPDTFPDFITMEPGGNRVTLITQRELTEDELKAFNLMKQQMGFHFEMDTVAQPHLFQNRPEIKVGFSDQKLLPKRYLKKLNIGTSLKKAWSEDQDLWHEHRIPLLRGAFYENSFLPESWSNDNYKCLLQTSSFPTDDFRNFLSLHDTVVAEMPFDNHQEEFLSSANITEVELLKLVEMGRVRFVMPYSIERYPKGFVEKISEVSPDSILFPRRLSCENILNLRKVAPFLMPSLPMGEKKILLATLMNAMTDATDPEIRNFLKFVVDDLSRIWMQLEYRINGQGPSSSSSVGLGFLADSMVKAHTGIDVGFELITTAPVIEWASTIKAAVVPIRSNGYSNEGQCRILLSMYHGIRSGPPVLNDRTKVIASQILSIGSKVSIVDFADQVRKGDLARFRRLVLDLSRTGGTEEHIAEATTKLNSEVKAYENKEHLLNKIDLVGLLLDFATSPPPPLSWLANLLTPVIEKKRTDQPVLGAFMDTLQGMRTLDPPHRPFIARLKKNLRDKID